MLKHKRENKLIACLDCWGCHGWMGPNHIMLKDGAAVCGACGKPNPLANMRRMSVRELAEPRLIWVPWTRSGTAAHALSTDGKTALGPWRKFSLSRHVGASAPVCRRHRLHELDKIAGYFRMGRATNQNLEQDQCL
jgi:hypothetical protein